MPRRQFIYILHHQNNLLIYYVMASTKKEVITMLKKFQPKTELKHWYIARLPIYSIIEMEKILG